MHHVSALVQIMFGIEQAFIWTIYDLVYQRIYKWNGLDESTEAIL